MRPIFILDTKKGRSAFYLFHLAASVLSALLFMRMFVRAFMSLSGEQEWLLPAWLLLYLAVTIGWTRGCRGRYLHLTAGPLVMFAGSIIWLYFFFA